MIVTKSVLTKAVNMLKKMCAHLYTLVSCLNRLGSKRFERPLFVQYSRLQLCAGGKNDIKSKLKLIN